MHKGRRLKPGDTVGLLSVSNPVDPREREGCVQAEGDEGRFYLTESGVS